MEELTVKEQKTSYVIGGFIVCSAIFLLVMEILFHAEVIPVWIYLMILAIFLSGILLCMEGRNRRLEVKGERLCYVNLLRKRKEFKLQDIGFVNAAWDVQRGQDYLRLYDKSGQKICGLAFRMKNAYSFFTYLYDNGITIDTAKDTGTALSDVTSQQQVEKDDIAKLTEKIYGETALQLKEWLEKNRKLDAQFQYGFAEYASAGMEKGKMPPRYSCMLEIYVKKEGSFVRDRKGKLVSMTFPVIYMRRSGSVSDKYKLCYNKDYSRKIAEALDILAEYLPRHKFTLSESGISHDLKNIVEK